MIVVEPFAPQHLDGFAKLFEGSSSSCFCRYWHFEGTKNEWLARAVACPEVNLDEQVARLIRGDVTARGFVAIDRSASDALIGWTKVAPRAAMPKLVGLPVYKRLPFEPATWSIGCFLVHPAARGRGVARALVSAAVEHVGAWGARFLEGYPRRDAARLHDEQAWQGPERVFVELGFTLVHDDAAYPVYRKAIAPPSD